MKNIRRYSMYLVFLLLLLSQDTSAQTDVCIEHADLNALDWKFRSGYDSSWLNLSPRDTPWISIKPGANLEELPDIRGGVRYTLATEIPVKQSCPGPIYLCVEQSCASAIYLDGRLLGSFGNMSLQADAIRAYDPKRIPIAMPLLEPGKHQLVIVADIQPMLRPRAMYGREFPLFKGKIFPREEAMSYQANRWSSGMEFLNGGILLLLFLIHFFSFLVDRSSKLHLWFCLFALFTFLGGIPGMTTFEPGWIDNKIRSVAFISIVGFLSAIFLSATFVQMLKPLSWKWGIPYALGELLMTFNNWLLPHSLKTPGLVILSLIGPGSILLISYQKMKRGNPSAKFVFGGALIYMTITATFLALYTNLPPYINDILFHIGFLTIPLSISMAISQQSRLTQLSLARETREKEKLILEKAQILENENQVLEQEVAKRTTELVQKNRDLEIEAAMDKIRARSLAMQKSDEIREVTGVMFAQLNELGIHCLTIAIQIFDFQKMHSTFWPGNTLASQAPKVILPYDENMMHADSCHKDLWKAMEEGKVIFNKAYTRQQKDRWFDYVFAHNDTSVIHEKARQFIRNAEQHIVCFVPAKHSAIFADTWDGSLFTAEQLEIFKRAASVFDQAYIRFLDLQKAEAQAREAQIEAALEKVRSRSLAMQNSSELEQVAIALFSGLSELGVSMSGALLFVFNHDKKEINLWVATVQMSTPVNISLPPDEEYNDNEILRELWNAAKSRLTGLNRNFSAEAQKEYFQFVHKYNTPKIPDDIARNQQTSKWNFTYASEYYTMLGVDSWSGHVFTESQLNTLKSFSRVFEQAYIRFLDLQKAEYQAREAVKRASLDRVRGEIASMRSQQDLDRITPLVWTELHNLGIRFSRCGIFIMDIPNHEVNVFLSSREGKSIAAFDLDFRKINLQDVVKHWEKHEVFVTHWNQEQFANLAEILVREQIINDESLYLDHLPDTGLHLHYIPFLQGMLYVAYTESLSQEELDLVQSLADSFSVAYARYEDFTRMEAAKVQTEQALDELKQTQAQLIQSEKMASLGELTAGIAHEIQNPLNFVNNFSDLNQELIDELKEELNKGDVKEAAIIAESLKENESKINLHGRRADSIVKSMLQHSRSSGGHKEPTDINKLVDEYVRLAYHGFRAKYKDFNVKLDIDLDPNLPRIPVVSQDIGRVILNLLNNAFQAVQEKAQTSGSNYQPTVSIQTSFPEGDQGFPEGVPDFPEGDPGLRPKGHPPGNLPSSTIHQPSSIIIRVADNGPGIPDNLKDKIFQPFFTTKPTGQGTGLGLSLSYDIIKAHGGEITANVGDDSGVAFRLSLPAS